MNTAGKCRIVDVRVWLVTYWPYLLRWLYFSFPGTKH